jgi:hypothetical protein
MVFPADACGSRARQAYSGSQKASERHKEKIAIKVVGSWRSMTASRKRRIKLFAGSKYGVNSMKAVYRKMGELSRRYHKILEKG